MSQTLELRFFGIWSVETLAWADEGFRYSEVIQWLCGREVGRRVRRWVPGVSEALQSVFGGLS